MKLAYTEPGFLERRAFEDVLHDKMPVSEIAASIGRQRSTVFCEIKLNLFEYNELRNLNGYYRVTVHRTAGVRRVRRRKLI